MDDTNNVDHPYMEDLVVELSKDASHQKSLTMDQIINGATSQIGAQNESKGVAKGLSYNLSHLKDASSEEIYIFPANREIFVSNVIVNTYYNVVDECPDVKWALSEDTTTISGYRCQKATTSFMGRNYQAWFTSDIPLPYGPWKLHGLPGLILTVSDLEEQIQFKFKGIEFRTGK